MKITSVMVHTGIMLHKTVTTEISVERHGADISWWEDKKGNAIGFKVTHKGATMGVPLGQVKQWNVIEDEPVRSAKAS